MAGCAARSLAQPCATPLRGRTAPIPSLVNARVYTVDAAQPEAEALAIRGDRLVAVGTQRRGAGLSRAATQVIDAGGRAVVPGPARCARPRARARAEPAAASTCAARPAPQAVVDARARPRDGSCRTGSWILGRGWDQNDWADTAWPTAAQLDAARPDHPVYLSRVDGHAALGQHRRAARGRAHRHGRTDPDGGRVMRDAAGEPAGVLVDTAMGLVARHIPPPDRAVPGASSCGWPTTCAAHGSA